jgi:peroxiredoxin
MRGLLLTVLIVTLGSAADAAREGTTPGRMTVPETLRDVHGETIDVAALAARRRLVVVTVKAPRCPVCRAQLERLRHALPRLQSCGATFIVLAPGPAKDLEELATATGFPFPFVEDRDLELGKSANLVLGPGQLVPGVFGVNEQREIVWVDRGRSDTRFSDEALFEYLECPPPSRA